MNQIKFKILPCLAFFLASGNIFADANFKAGSYQIDSRNSKIGFEVSHFVVSSVQGKFTHVDGTIELNEKFENSQVKASIEISSVDTDSEKRDAHLKGPDFFNAAEFPKMTFESTSITGRPESFKMTGNLTIKGVKRVVTFEGKKVEASVDQSNPKVAFNVKNKISRKEFGITNDAGLIGDGVKLDLTIEAGQSNTEAQR